MSDPALRPTDLPDPSRRFLLGAGAAMGLGAGLAWWARPTPVAVTARPSLDALVPTRFGEWRSDRRTEALVRPPAENGKFYGLYDQVVERIYVAPDQPPVMMCLAWGSEQSVGLQAHRPEICYPSAGFRVSGLRREAVDLAGQRVPLTRLHARLGPRSEPVSYWMLLGESAVEDDLAWRWRQFREGLRGRVLDGLLVRLSTLEPDGPVAYDGHLRFARSLIEALAPADRALLVGRPASA